MDNSNLNTHHPIRSAQPNLIVSLIPIAVLLATLVAIIVVAGAESVQDYSYFILAAAAAVCIAIGLRFGSSRSDLTKGMRSSARQILPAVPILLFIGTLSATWMLSGVVPALVEYGLLLLRPETFLFMSCVICSVVSVVTGSSWTTIATIGVALMGVGLVMGYDAGWVAGAIISGSYFGDKVSPLSDTTVLAASSCKVPVFAHIRNLMLTSLPAMTVALAVYLIVGYTSDLTATTHSAEITDAIGQSFNVSPWVLLIPGITVVMILLRTSTVAVMAVGTAAGLAGMWIFQPQVVEQLCEGNMSIGAQIAAGLRVMLDSTAIDTGSELLNPLVGTGGVRGMLPTVYLICAAMAFGGAMIGTGMLKTITQAITRRLNKARSLVVATVGSGLFLNSCTGDQYLSIIIGGNVFRSTYQRLNMRPQTLSRTLEDSISVTSVLIPWNSCGVTQSTVLGVATLAYLPFCLFNLLSPVMTILMAFAGWRLHHRRSAVAAVEA